MHDMRSGTHAARSVSLPHLYTFPKQPSPRRDPNLSSLSTAASDRALSTAVVVSMRSSAEVLPLPRPDSCTSPVPKPREEPTLATLLGVAASQVVVLPLCCLLPVKQPLEA